MNPHLQTLQTEDFKKKNEDGPYTPWAWGAETHHGQVENDASLSQDSQ
jgi:hypothetical protein